MLDRDDVARVWVKTSVQRVRRVWVEEVGQKMLPATGVPWSQWHVLLTEYGTRKRTRWERGRKEASVIMCKVSGLGNWGAHNTISKTNKKKL